MFRNRITASPFLVREITGKQDNSLTPKVGDIATLIVDENDIQIQINLEDYDHGNWKGSIVSYHLGVKQRTPAERLEEIKTQEKFINDNDLSIGSEISIPEIKIFGLSRS